MTKPKYHYKLEQGTDEWLAIRTGILTASEVKLILSPTLKMSNNEKTRQHIYEIAAQRITGYTEPSFITDDMLRGHGDEILARSLYCDKYDKVDECGFVTRVIDGVKFGYSPDGLVGKNGLIEIKSRRQKYHVQTIVDGEVPSDYILQCQTGLLVTGRKWLDFISYSGGLPMFVCRVTPSEEIQGAIIEAAKNFEQQVIDCIKAFKSNSKNLHPTERVNHEAEIEIE